MKRFTWDSTIKVIQLVSIILGSVSIVLGVVGFFRTLKQEKDIEVLQYNENALKYQPQLDVKLASLGLNVNFKFASADTTEKRIDIVATYDTATVSLYLHNSGNVNAQYLGCAWLDSLSGAPTIREDMLGGQTINKALVRETSFFTQTTISKDATDSTTIAIHSYHPAGRSGTFHIILFYENALHQWFDTYYWIHYRIENPDLGGAIFEEGKFRFPGATKESAIRQMFKLENTHTHYYSYTVEEKEKAEVYLNRQ